jgi:type II secretory ATPase GspE/PulE/Tfp pilus assembly ATPase PilB-like protein
LPDSATPDPAIQKELKLDGSKRTDVNISKSKAVKMFLYRILGPFRIFEFLGQRYDQRLILDKKVSYHQRGGSEDGNEDLEEDGWMKVKQGVTTIPEVLELLRKETLGRFEKTKSLIP